MWPRRDDAIKHHDECADEDMRPRRMRVLATSLLVLAALAAAPASSVAQLPPLGDTVDQVVEPVRDVVNQLPPPVSGPVNDVLDQLPPLPSAPVPTPVPVPTAAPTVRPVPTRTPAAEATPAGTTRPAPASTRAPSGTARQPSRTVARPAPRTRASRPARRPAPATTSAPGRSRLVAARGEEARPTSSPEARRAEPVASPSFGARATNQIGDIVRAIPAEILWALLGISVIAIGLAINAYWQSRRRVALETQRAELLDDIGLLSRALLPAMPEGLGGVAVSAAYRPADGPAAGGDFYDVFAIGDERIGVLLGDVSGHGRESVTQAALARYTLRTLLAAGDPPGEALARADVLLARELRPNFVTVIAGVYDTATGVLTYAKAGHAPPIVLGTHHDPDAEDPAPPIGIGVWEYWPEYRLQLGAGVSICLFTDGLQDAQIGDARLGRDAVQEMLAAQEVPDAGRLLSDVEGAADRVCDDTAAVVLSCPGT
jgi:hypothetical protein